MIFCKTCTETLNNHAPRKRKVIRGNQCPFINKEISKAIIKGSELHNKFLKHKRDESKQAFVKQRNYYVSLLRKSKKNYYSNLYANELLTIRNSGKL